MAGKKNKKKVPIKLTSTETTFYFLKYKNTGVSEKLNFRKYDPILRKHVMFEEKKFK